jgi:hypothetical protein
MRIDTTEELDQFCYYTGPARLMARSQSSAVIPMEVLVKQNAILPVRIGLEFIGPSIHWPPARLVTQEDPCQPIGNFPRYLKQIHEIARASWALNLEVITVIKVVRQERAKQQSVHRHPDGTAPIGVSTEHATNSNRHCVISPYIHFSESPDAKSPTCVLGQ